MWQALWWSGGIFRSKDRLSLNHLFVVRLHFPLPYSGSSQSEGASSVFIIIRGNERKPKRKTTPRKAFMVAAAVSVRRTARNDPRYGQNTRRLEIGKAASRGGRYRRRRLRCRERSACLPAGLMSVSGISPFSNYVMVVFPHFLLLLLVSCLMRRDKRRQARLQSRYG